MHEVVAAKPNQKEEGTQWTVNFFQIPNMGETTMLMLGSMMIFQFVKLSLAAEYLREDYQEELYGGGTSNKTTSIKNARYVYAFGQDSMILKLK